MRLFQKEAERAAISCALLIEWVPMIEKLLNFCEKNLIQIQITQECIEVLVRHNSYKQMCSLLSQKVSVT